MPQAAIATRSRRCEQLLAPLEVSQKIQYFSALQACQSPASARLLVSQLGFFLVFQLVVRGPEVALHRSRLHSLLRVNGV